MENTNLDLAQCQEDLLALISCNAPDGGVLSESELEGAIGIARQAAALVQAMQEAWGVDVLDLPNLEEHIADVLRNNNATVKELLADDEESE